MDINNPTSEFWTLILTQDSSMDVYGKTGACPGGNRDYPCIHNFIVEDIHNLGSSSNEKQAYSILHAYNPSSSIEAAEWRWAQNRDYPFSLRSILLTSQSPLQLYGYS
jgi:hypothetical protein